MHNDEKINLLLDEAKGIYIPNSFYMFFDFPFWGLNRSEFTELNNPDNELYWDAWDDLLRDARHTDKKGITWGLWQDGSLFAVTDDYDFEGVE